MTPNRSTDNNSFELISSSDNAQGEMNSDTKLVSKVQKKKSKRIHSNKLSKRMLQDDESSDSEVEEEKGKDEESALKNFAEAYFGKSKAKLIRQTELEEDSNEDLSSKRKVRMNIKQKDISTSNQAGVKSLQEEEEEEEIMSTPRPQGTLSPFKRLTLKQRKHTPMIMPQPKKLTSKLSTIEVISEAELDSSETEQLEQYKKLSYLEEEDLTSELDEVSTIGDGQVEFLKEAEQGSMFSRENLKKVETIKIEIEESKLETVELSHHDFESVPLDNIEEQISSVILINPLDYYEDIKIEETPQHEQKGIIGENESKEEISKHEKKSSENIKNQSDENIAGKKREHKGLRIPESKSDKTEDSDLGKPELEIKQQKSLPFKRGKLSTVTKEPLKTSEEQKPLFIKPQLKKTEIVKSKIEKTKLESVHLKHHEFEIHPQDNENEEPSNVRLQKPLYVYEDDKLVEEKEKPKRKKTIKSVKNKEKANDKNTVQKEIKYIEKKTFPPDSALKELNPPMLDKEVVLRWFLLFLFFFLRLIVFLRW